MFEVPFTFPATGTGHVPGYPCCLVPNGKFVQCFMQPKRCRLACQGQVKQISLERNACGAVHVSWVVTLLCAYAKSDLLCADAFRIRLHPFKKIKSMSISMVSRIADSYMGN